MNLLKREHQYQQRKTDQSDYMSFMILYFQLVSNFVILLSANMMGIGHKYLTDLHHRHTFLEARSMIQVKKKLEWENNQRVSNIYTTVFRVKRSDVKHKIM